MKKIDIKNIKVIQAPLAGISDIVFRQLIRHYDKKCLLTTEMLSSEALSNVPDPAIARFDELEYPLSFQLVGHKPALMAKAAKIFNNKASAIDLNFGCPVNKVVKSGDGSAMMRTPQLAADIVKAVKDVIDAPLSAKFRLGWSVDDMNFVEFARTLEDAGVDFITVHARTRSQMYSGDASWKNLAELKNAVKIPVFANGDVKTVEDAIECLKITQAHGVSVGRGLMGDFTLTSRIEHYFTTGEILPEPALADKIAMLKEHMKRETVLRGETHGVKFMRKFYNFYISGVCNASKYRQELVRLEKAGEVERVLDDIVQSHACPTAARCHAGAHIRETQPRTSGKSDFHPCTPSSYWLYILRTTRDTLYCGIALDVDKRFKEHFEGKGAKYTRANKPVEVVYKKEFETKSEALKEEIRIKAMSRKEKLELVNNP